MADERVVPFNAEAHEDYAARTGALSRRWGDMTAEERRAWCDWVASLGGQYNVAIGKAALAAPPVDQRQHDNGGGGAANPSSPATPRPNTQRDQKTS